MQLNIWLWAALFAALSGLAGHGIALAINKYKGTDYHLDWWEYGIGLFLALALIIPGVVKGGAKAAFHNNVTFHQNIQGWETEAIWTKTTCEEDGSCRHCYDCHPYTVQVPYECGSTVGTGKNAHYESRTCYRTETRYHSCPYVTEEWNFYGVNTLQGQWTISSGRLPSTPQNPDPDHWRWSDYSYSERVPADAPEDMGIPIFWQQMHDRIASGDPGPVTVRNDYTNYILASRLTTYQRYADSGQLAAWKKQGLLPDLTHNIQFPYYENRVYAAGVNLQNANDWQWDAQQFDAAAGDKKLGGLQADVDVVVVNANQIQNPDEYANALVAYWQSPAFGKDALSKNGIVVVIATADNQTIAWARALTGMPTGNEQMLNDIRDQLKGQKLDPGTVFGHPRFDIQHKTLNHTSGLLENILWGQHAFQRVHMEHGDNGGFSYLKYDVQLTSSQQNWILFWADFTSLLIWLLCFFFDIPAGVQSVFQQLKEAIREKLHSRN